MARSSPSGVQPCLKAASARTSVRRSWPDRAVASSTAENCSGVSASAVRANRSTTGRRAIDSLGCSGTRRVSSRSDTRSSGGGGACRSTIRIVKGARGDRQPPNLMAHMQLHRGVAGNDGGPHFVAAKQTEHVKPDVRRRRSQALHSVSHEVRRGRRDARYDGRGHELAEECRGHLYGNSRSRTGALPGAQRWMR